MKTLGVVHVQRDPSPQPTAAFLRSAGRLLPERMVRRDSESLSRGFLLVAISGASDDHHVVSGLVPADVPILSLTMCRDAAAQWAEMAGMNRKAQGHELPTIDNELLD